MVNDAVVCIQYDKSRPPHFNRINNMLRTNLLVLTSAALLFSPLMAHAMSDGNGQAPAEKHMEADLCTGI